MADWYRKNSTEVMSGLATSAEGLTMDEAETRLEKYGFNKLTEKKRENVVKRFLLQFHNLLIYVLLIAAIITTVLGEWVDSGVILGVVIINAVIGFLQESKAEQALASLKEMLSLTGNVVREGVQMQIPAELVVPGDIVVLSSGDKVPADLRLFKTRNLHVDESALTGESIPVSKQIDSIDNLVEIGDRINMAFNGTFVTSGQGFGIVTATGDHTELGKIAGMLQEVEEVKTPLTVRLASFSKSLTFVIVIGCLVIYLFGTYVKDLPSIDMFMATVAIAISAIPEGLPAIMTITLAIGVTRMAARNSIIRKLPAVETLGSTGIICTDKTGTLTRNEMTVTRLITPEGDFDITGTGYIPAGTFTKAGEKTDLESCTSITELLRAGILCNDAILKHEENEWKITGDPTEAALIVAARKALLDKSSVDAGFPRNDSIPFESEQRFMATLHHDHHGNSFIYVKGAPEKIISVCNKAWGSDGPFSRDSWETYARDMAAKGLRVLGIAYRKVSQTHEQLTFSDISEGGFTMLGLTGLLDPLRQEVKLAVAACRDAGIRVKIITGDHALTARDVASNLELGNEVRTGVELDQLNDQEFDQIASTVNVFARVNPEHKLRLVHSLQKQGEIVAMTGDGVNDAPALKQADIGIAMGRTGTEVSKEAADMVITDDNFTSIEQAVEEGRTVFNNLKKTIMFILPTNGGECLVIIWAILTGSLLPVLPLHILWINLITTVALAITLAFEPVESGTMEIPPRKRDEPIIERYLIWRIVIVSVVMAAGTFGLFYYETSHGQDLESARTVAVNTIVFFEIFYIFNTRFLTAGVIGRKGLFDNKFILIGVAVVITFQMLFTYWSGFNRLFNTQPIDLYSWTRIILISMSIFFIIEFEKYITGKIIHR